MKLVLEDIWKDILALVPCEAGAGGNGTKVLLGSGGEKIDSRRIVTVLGGLCRLLAVDLSSVRSQARVELGRKANVPLVLHERLVLVPVLFRRPAFKNQGATGYVNSFRVASLDHVSTRVSVISFDNGSTLPCMNSAIYLRRSRNAAARMREVYLRRHGRYDLEASFMIKAFVDMLKKEQGGAGER